MIAKFLMPLDVPSEYMQDENIEELVSALGEVKAEFIEAHKEYESKNERPISEIASDIEKVEEERKQLLDRLQREQSQPGNNHPDFQRLLTEVHKLRVAQDSEIRLEEQSMEQKSLLLTAKGKLDIAKRMRDITASCEGKKSIGEVLDALESEAEKAVEHLETNVIPKRQEAEVLLLHGEKNAAKLEKVGVEHAAEMEAQLEDTLLRKQDELARIKVVGTSSSKVEALKEVRRHCSPLRCILYSEISLTPWSICRK